MVTTLPNGSGTPQNQLRNGQMIVTKSLRCSLENSPDPNPNPNPIKYPWCLPEPIRSMEAPPLPRRTLPTPWCQTPQDIPRGPVSKPLWVRAKSKIHGGASILLDLSQLRLIYLFFFLAECCKFIHEFLTAK